MAHAQLIRSCGVPSPLSYGGVGVGPAGVAAPPAAGPGSFSIAPSLCLSERYDTNVFYAGPQPGLQRNDFVTNVSPAVQVNHMGDYASGFFRATGFNETYIHNSGLNFFGGGGTLSLNLDNTIKRLLPNATLRIDDTVRYTPLPPGVVNPLAGTSPSDAVNTQNAFARGMLAFRTNNLVNNGMLSASYAITGSSSVDAAYTHSMLRFGSSSLTAGLGPFGGLFDVTSHSAMIGGGTQVTGLDKLSIKYSYTRTEFSSSTAGVTRNEFDANTVSVGWSRTLTPTLRAEVGGGAIVIDPGLTTYAANAALIANLPSTVTTLSYSRTAFPSIQAVATALVGDSISLTSVHKLSQSWHLAGSGSFIHSSGVSGSEALIFDTYLASADIYYWITPVWSAALSYDYWKFDSSFAAGRTQFDRHAATFAVRAAFE